MSIKEIIITALVASAFSTMGFFGGRYFEQKDKKQVFVEQIYKGLYDKNSEVFNKIQDAYSVSYTHLDVYKRQVRVLSVHCLFVFVDRIETNFVFLFR